MSNIYVKEVSDFKTTEENGLDLYVEEKKKKLAVIFPGIGYHTDKPLLYYSKKLALCYGYDIREIQYGTLPTNIKGDKQKMFEAFEIASEYAAIQLADEDFSRYADVLFISKSIGTAVASAFAQKHCIAAKQIYYTPVEESFLFMGEEGIVFHGTADPWARTDIVEEECRKKRLPLYETAGANHSLETGNVKKDLSNLSEIMRQTEEYIAGKCCR